MLLVLFNRCYHSGTEWTWERWQWRGTPHSPKIQHCWNLTIRLFSVIYSEHLLGGWSYPSAEKQSVYSTATADWAIWDFEIETKSLNFSQKTRPSVNNKRSCHIVKFVIPADHRVKVKIKRETSTWTLPEN